MQKPDCRLKSDRTSGTEERGTVTRKREWPTLDRLVAQFRRPTREKVYYTLAQPSSNVVFFFHSVSGARLGGQRLPPPILLFLRSVLPLSWHPLLSGPPIAPTWHERRLYKRARATTCFLLSPPPLAATGTPGLAATLPPVGQRYFTRRFPITFSYTSLPFLHTSGVVLHVAFRCSMLDVYIRKNHL